MRNDKSLIISLLSSKVESFELAKKVTMPESGWITAIRTSLNMTLEQLGKKTGKTKQAISRLEKSEAEGKISLATLRDTAGALDMQLVYAIVPRTGTLEDYVETRARKMAEKIVQRTNRQMVLEAQELREAELQRAVAEATKEIIRTMDRKMWE